MGEGELRNDPEISPIFFNRVGALVLCSIMTTY